MKLKPVGIVDNFVKLSTFKTTNKIIYLFVCCFSMFSCGLTSTSKYDESESNFLIFDLENTIGLQRIATVTLNSIIDSVRFIPLETTKESVFFNIANRFGVIGKNMFISGGIGDRISAVLQFSQEGKYIGQIAQRGHGPTELPNLFAWYVHGALQQINAVGDSKIVIKSFKNDKITNFRKETSVNFNMIPLSDSSFVATGFLSEEYKNFPYLYFLDANGKEIASMHYAKERDIYTTKRENNQRIDAWPHEMRIIVPRFSGDALFHDAYNDTTYLIRSATDIKPYFLFVRGKYMPIVKDALNVEKKNNQVFIRNIMETEDYIFLTTVYNRNFFYDIWCKKSRQLYSRSEADSSLLMYRMGGFWTYCELPNGSKQLINIQYVEKNTIYAIIDAETAITFMEGIHEEDNPVIMVAKLKPAATE